MVHSLNVGGVHVKTHAFLFCMMQAVASACGISAMPTFQVFKDGAKVEELVGASKDRLKAMIAKYA